MSYQLVLPRDLFNQSKLLKCIGRISLYILDNMTPVDINICFSGKDDMFIIEQDPASGNLFIYNINIL